MRKKSQRPNQAEIRRRQEQSARDLERNRRQHAEQEARLAQLLQQRPTPFIPTQPSIHVGSSIMAWSSYQISQPLSEDLPNPATSPQQFDADLKRVFDSLFNNSSRY
ncbi:hypothetical protein EAF04_004348 [Stromatinia cepivora]|nr:hypothetical protein EAF04_004348 [Stromatinia cepivora]